MKQLVVIDGQGGGMGKQLIAAIKAAHPQFSITAVGTNAIATAAMIKAGADKAATGSNAVVVACRTADVIVGPVGIVIADALMGEMTQEMAAAVGRSPERKLLLPFNACGCVVVGAQELSLGALVRQTVALLDEMG